LGGDSASGLELGLIGFGNSNISLIAEMAVELTELGWRDWRTCPPPCASLV